MKKQIIEQKAIDITNLSDWEIAKLLKYKKPVNKHATQDDYFDELEEREERKAYANNFNGSYEASKGDYEGACLARAEFEGGYIS